LMLFYTGIKRTASTIAQTYVNDIDKSRRQLRIMKDLVDESLAILNSRQDLTAFGELLHEAWQAKRSLSASVSNAEVDDLYQTAMAAGAIGGKLTGAGGGGFLLLFVPPDRQEQVRTALSGLIHVPFKFEFSGSQILFADNEQDYSREEQLRTQQSIRSFRELPASAIAR
jgi:D-glycero-alpha-D-manno-heptose-7-phosphate kinase